MGWKNVARNIKLQGFFFLFSTVKALPLFSEKAPSICEILKHLFCLLLYKAFAIKTRDDKNLEQNEIATLVAII